MNKLRAIVRLLFSSRFYVATWHNSKAGKRTMVGVTYGDADLIIEDLNNSIAQQSAVDKTMEILKHADKV